MKKFTHLWQPKNCFLLLLLASGMAANATPKGIVPRAIIKPVQWPITGRVTSANGEPLPGVTVLLKGTTTGTATGSDGSFTLNVPETAGTLVVSFIGYATQEKSFSGPGAVNITLVDDAKALEEVVVVGYGTQKKESVTGAISSVSAKDIAELPVPSVAQALQGRVAGVTVVNTGTPGTAPVVRIRGIGSVSFSSDPLYVVDGVPTSGLTGIDNKDIQSVQVLKDAAATAIYGSRAANGVILITTKNGGKDGKMRVSFDSSIGTQQAWRKLDVLNTEQYVQYANMLLGNAGLALPPRLAPAEFNKPIYEGTTQTYAQTNTNWQDELFKNGILTQNNITLAGGTDKSQFYTSAGYFKQEGITQGVGFDRYNLRVNSTHAINKFVTVGERIYGSYGKQNQDFDPGSTRSRLTNALRSQPYMPVYDPTKRGGFRESDALDASDPGNPVRDALMNVNENRTVKLLGNVDVELRFTEWLRFKTTGGVDYDNNLNFRYQPIYNAGGAVNRDVANVNNGRSINQSLLLSNQLTFDKTFGRHYVNVIAVQERQSFKSVIENISGNQPTNDIKTVTGALDLTANQAIGESLLISYLSRVNYEFGGKYLLSASVRYDGSSKFAPGQKWGTFPAASVGWRISEEPFMKGISQLSDLKLRASYGAVGFNGLGNYDWQVLAQVNQNAYPFAGNLALGSYYSGISNRQLRWEITNMKNAGIDVGLFNNKVTLSAEYFDRTTSDENGLILSVPTPASFGFNGAGVFSNVGKMKNNGFELQAGYNETENAFQWSVSANYSRIKNEVISLTAASPTLDNGANADFGGYNITRTTAGQPIQSFYGWVVDGIFQTADEVAQANAKDGDPTTPFQAVKTGAGDIRFKDINNDGKITDADRDFLGSYLPKFSYGLNGTANYMNFDLSLFFQGVGGNKIYNNTRVITEGGLRLFNAGTQVLDAWTPTNTDSNIPRMISGDPNGNNRTSDRFLENGSYLRLKNVTLGYTIPQATLSSFSNNRVSGLRIYFTSQNLLTLTNYSGYDPEIGTLGGGLLTNGVDFGQYPQARTFTGGIQLTF